MSVPVAVERISNRSPMPFSVPIRLVLSLWATSKASATSLTMPLASWQELAKPWLSACSFFCRVSITSMQSLHMVCRAISKA